MTGIWILTGMFLFIGALFTWLGYGNLVSARKKRASWIAVQEKIGTVGLLKNPHPQKTAIENTRVSSSNFVQMALFQYPHSPYLIMLPASHFSPHAHLLILMPGIADVKGDVPEIPALLGVSCSTVMILLCPASVLFRSFPQ